MSIHSILQGMTFLQNNESLTTGDKKILGNPFHEVILTRVSFKDLRMCQAQRERKGNFAAYSPSGR